MDPPMITRQDSGLSRGSGGIGTAGPCWGPPLLMGV